MGTAHGHSAPLDVELTQVTQAVLEIVLGRELKHVLQQAQQLADLGALVLPRHDDAGVLAAVAEPAGMERREVLDVERHQCATLARRVRKLLFIRSAEHTGVVRTYDVVAAGTVSPGDEGIFVLIEVERDHLRALTRELFRCLPPKHARPFLHQIGISS